MNEATPIELIELRLKQQGKKKGWLADQLDITPQYLSMIFSGTRALPDHVKASAYRILGIN